MKLQTKATLYYLLFVLPVLAAGGIALYMLLTREIRDTVDELLWKEKLKIEEQVQDDDTLDAQHGRIENELEITKLPGKTKPVYFFSDTMLFDHEEEEVIPYRVLTFTSNGDMAAYRVTLRQSTMEADDLIENIALVIVVIFLLLLTGFILINFFVTRRLWRPFNTMLASLREYHPDGKQQLKPVKSNTYEFEKLDAALVEMSAKISNDFRSLKEFTQDASHEIQTPLAIIRSKLELLLQDNRLPKETLELAVACNDACLRLSKLNKALLLLTKLENNEFQSEAVALDEIIAAQLDHLQEFIQEKDIDLQYRLEPVKAQCNRMLADIMITNLLGNAIRHNVQNGTIAIDLREGELIIKNSGNEPGMEPSLLFERFRKSDPSSSSLGLGLSIVKKIAEVHRMKIEYTVEDKQHIFKLTF